MVAGHLSPDLQIKEFEAVDADITFSDRYKLKLSSKKLRSGKCQVKFYATVRDKKDLHGYVLVESDQTLKSVVNGIKDRLHTIHESVDFQHIHLYSIGKRSQENMGFIFFDA